ncbi:MAG: NAD-dependent epimerase/dehydratase family protein, partial [Planctomycetota bacterium]|nr:NAD-dependent epimerase/dehydratase family protein [Planctomycetota bacterium]
MTVFLTGATGFLGGHLALKLAESGEKVHCLVRKGSQRDHLKDCLDSLKFFEGSLDDSPESLAAMKAGLDGVDSVIHVAGATKKSNVTKERLFAINEGGTKILLDAVIAAAPKIKRFVFVSTMAASGPCVGSEVKNEEHPALPVSDYGASKKAAEAMVLARKDDLPITILRPPGITGPRDPTTLSLFKLVQRHLRPVGSRRANFVHVDDIVSGILLLQKHEKAVGEVFHIGTENHSISEIGRIIAKLLDTWSVPLFVPGFVFYILAVFGMLLSPLMKPFMDFEKAREYTAS